MAFECRHCGQCCVDDCTQINLSIGDIVRISKFLNIGIGGLMDKIGMKPFCSPENTNEFEYELGLNLPCSFRKDGKCSIYAARPLNCRIFPSFFLGNFEEGQLADVIDPSHKCIVSGIRLTAGDREIHRKYSELIGSLIMEEAKMTEEFYKANRLKQSKILPAYVFPAEDPNNPMQAREITKSKIRMAMQIMDKKPYAELRNQLQNFIMLAGKDITPLEKINSAEKEILSQPF